jgi:hypothetical protein
MLVAHGGHTAKGAIEQDGQCISFASNKCVRNGIAKTSAITETGEEAERRIGVSEVVLDSARNCKWQRGVLHVTPERVLYRCVIRGYRDCFPLLGSALRTGTPGNDSVVLGQRSAYNHSIRGDFIRAQFMAMVASAHLITAITRRSSPSNSM